MIGPTVRRRPGQGSGGWWRSGGLRDGQTGEILDKIEDNIARNIKTDRTAGRKCEVSGNISIKLASELLSRNKNFVFEFEKYDKDDGLLQDILDTVMEEDYL